MACFAWPMLKLNTAATPPYSDTSSENLMVKRALMGVGGDGEHQFQAPSPPRLAQRKGKQSCALAAGRAGAHLCS